MQEPDKTLTFVLILIVVLWTTFVVHKNKNSADKKRKSFCKGFLARQKRLVLPVMQMLLV